MNEYDVLKSIAENLSQRENKLAAFSNYEVLCNNTKYVNALFDNGLRTFTRIQERAAASLRTDAHVGVDLQDDSKPLFYFRKIVPRILLNGISMCEKLQVNTEPDDRSGVKIDTLGMVKRGFIDYNNLVTSARQYIDSLVSDSYQLVLLDPKSLNYHVLNSLNSFNKYVTESIRNALFNKEIEDALKEVERFTQREWHNSHITKCAHISFATKVDYLFSTLNITGEDAFKDEIKNLFKFSSEFTHIGYVSTLFTSSDVAELIFMDDIGHYLPSTENFSELKYEILGTAIRFYYTVYLPAVAYSFGKLFEPAAASSLQSDIASLISEFKSKYQTRYNAYKFFVREGLLGSNEVINLTCMCGTTRSWNPPHEGTELFCKGCGSTFVVMETLGDPGYLITPAGVLRVIGSSVPDFRDLPPEEQQDLLEKVKEMKASLSTPNNTSGQP